MIEGVNKRIIDSEPFHQLAATMDTLQPEHPIQMRGISGSLMAFVGAYLFEKLQGQVLLIVPDQERCEQLRDDCATLIDSQFVYMYTAGPSHAGMQLDVSAPIAQVETLRALSKGEQILIIASAEALSVKIPDSTEFSRRIIEMEVRKEYPFEQLLATLASLGFEKKDFVEEYGDYAVRGGILDVFPFVGDNPIRFEFWGDTIESIREFDALSQRSIRELQTASVVANIHYDFPNNDTTQIINSTAATKFQATLFDYLIPNALVIFDEPLLIEREIDELFQEGYQNIFDWKGINESVKSYRRLLHSIISSHDSSSIIDFRSNPQPPIGGSIKRLVEQIARLSTDNYSIYLACDTKDEGERLNELIEEELTAPNNNEELLERNSVSDLLGEKPEGGSNPNIEDTNTSIVDNHSPISYQLLPEALHSGFIFQPAQIAIFTEHEIFGRLKRRGLNKRRKFKGISQKELQQLQRGDFVVHQEYGIGKFAGLQKIKLRDIETEVMKLLYEGNDSLYVNINFINRVQKYSSREGYTPKLSKLGSPDWERLQLRAKKKIKDIARDLIRLYARRKLEPGFFFSPDTHWQKELEASFIYEDTADQTKATLDVKQDMESPSPMDRLICGDVGFGKTEVAVRAAFKTVMNSKQVALLVPTTILAQQHFNTFLDRVGRYSVCIESLSRFRTRKEQTTILDALEAGRIDILIGTHRILSKDVIFKDLGLLIIDEEHRFGVKAKEKLRQFRATVDTLTLTATPIPRTLQFSLMGARDLSLINTPPRNRLPIQTEIAQFDLQLIREAIIKEIHRGGQVYFVHDRVQNIDLILAMLEEHIPKARFHVAHGQMKGHKLEKTMMDFLEKKFDVLICTKIIESGIDIPSVNTIIINRADRFGMAELYQLRGRVGRSNVQAYAYLLTPPLSILPRQTLRRLQAIQEFTELGSGFNLAMRDLEIRGAGNLLGGEQSGFILEMGFEMYQRIVEEAVQELKEEEFKELTTSVISQTKKTETIIETDIEAFIPDVYIESDAERLDIYRRLYQCESLDKISAMRLELQDRFGEYPEEVENLFQLVELKTVAANIGLTKIELSGNTLVLHFPSPENTTFYEGDDPMFQKMIAGIQGMKHIRPLLKQESNQLKLIAKIEESPESKKRLEAIKKLFEELFTFS